MDGTSVSPSLVSVMPVSYTHLDVYKRHFHYRLSKKEGWSNFPSFFYVNINSVFDFLICRRLQQFGFFQKLSQQLDCLGVIVAVGKALVDRESQIQHLVHLVAAVGLENRTQRFFTDDAEHRAGAPVCQVMVAAVQLDRAEVRDDDCAVVGVRLDVYKRQVQFSSYLKELRAEILKDTNDKIAAGK